jgi:hypothetical protein
MFLLIFAAQVAAAPSNDGCMGHTLAQCIAQMDTALRVDESDISRQLSRASERDVNGKPIGGSNLVTAMAYFADLPSPHILNFRLDDAGNVSSVEISLAGNPQFSRTAQEYSDTGLGAAFRAVLPKSCTAPEGDVAAFKLFENVIKPTIKIGDKDTTIDETHASTDRFSRSAPVPYCGLKVRFSNLSGYDTNDISEYNEHGAYSLSTIEFTP